jgi:hypothetical protein
MGLLEYKEGPQKKFEWTCGKATILSQRSTVTHTAVMLFRTYLNPKTDKQTLYRENSVTHYASQQTAKVA